MKKSAILLICFFISCSLKALNFYVSPDGNDATGDGSKTLPWKTIAFALRNIPSGTDQTLRLSTGTFIESTFLHVPPFINIEGENQELTIIQPAPHLYYNPTTPGLSAEKFLFILNSDHTSGKQSLKNFTIDGAGRKLHGGIYINNRDNILVDNIKIQNVNFCAIWLLNSKGSSIKNTTLLNSAWASNDWCSGALQLANLTDTDIYNLHINEDRGYGIKALGTESPISLSNVKIHDSRISVNPTGIWNNGAAPNISIELWSANLTACEIYNCYVDNHISLVKADFTPPKGKQTIRVHHNTIDLGSRAKGQGYGLELSVNEVEVDHNVFLGGQYGIVNWSDAVKSWSIHHNIFYGLKNDYPSEVLRSQKSGLHNVKFYNNTVEFAGKHTVNLIGLYGGASKDVEVKNNLVINSNTAYSHYPNKVAFIENAAIDGLVVERNLFFNIDPSGLEGYTKNNLLLDPKVKKVGTRHTQYYQPTKGSPLIDAGIDVKLPYKGSAPDIGAHEY
jgi:hypothetical protein